MDAWFLSFLWRRPDDDCWHPVEAAVDEHPLDYMTRARDANPGHEFRLLFFSPISRDVYLRHHPAA